MPSTHTSLHYHVVFSTKDRFPHIANDWREDLHAYIGGCVRAIGGAPLQVGGMFDHVHVLLGLKPTHAIADAIREIKKASTSWVQETADRKFRWQIGYGAFTVSRHDLDRIDRYIRNQHEHHKRVTFQDEYLAFLTEEGIEFDPRFLW